MNTVTQRLYTADSYCCKGVSQSFKNKAHFYDLCITLRPQLVETKNKLLTKHALRLVLLPVINNFYDAVFISTVTKFIRVTD